MSKTAVIEGRLDLRDLASCADYFVKNNMPATSRSDLLYKIVATFANAAQAQGSRAFTSTEDALAFMTSLNIGMMNRTKREGRLANAFTLAKVIKSERSMEGFKAIDVEQEELKAAMMIFNTEKKEGE